MEYKQQVIGNIGGFMGTKGVPIENLEREMKTIVNEIVNRLSKDMPHPITKSYARARERWE